MIQFITENLEKNPNLTFVEFSNRKYSYEEFFYQVIHSARILNSYEIPHRNLIGIQIENNLEFLIQWFACNFLGLTSVLLNPKAYGEELQKYIESVQLKTLITNRKSIDQLSNYKLDLIFIEDSPSISLCGNELNKFNWSVDDVVTIIFTSGSDGIPKPVELTISNFTSSFYSWNSEIQFVNDKIINFLPLHHISGISPIFRGLLSKTPIHLINKFQINKFINYCKINHPTIVSMVPTVIYKLLKTKEGIDCLNSFKMILVGGGPSSKNILKTCLKHDINIFITYGMTETCSGISGFWIKNNKDKLDSVGKPLKDVVITTKYTSEEFSQICIKGNMVAKGYFKNNKFNYQFNSDDYGKYDIDGFLYLKPLRNDKIISGGENVNPIDVENVILEISGIIGCCVVGIEDEVWGEKIIAFITRKKNIEESLVLKHCKKRLLDFKIPKKIIFCVDLPQNELGKINRKLAKKLIINSEHI
ncbi:MAG: hypothetical protein CMF96_10425 [Candidatus Marinimicrobia bacterium]|nr:hypothetical protein [Candidatus Neomarinimicrobiota bacterium]|tara:strand:- start:14373 stop:15797 length:1425 start_codon:yes stop_codon:yes gene_type:complete